MIVTLIAAGLIAFVSGIIILMGMEPVGLSFNAYAIWHKKQWYRLITYSFVHGSWRHLIYNMVWVLGLGFYLNERLVGRHELLGEFVDEWIYYLMIISYYIGAIVFSTLGDLLIYKNNPNFNAVGTSGIVAALLFTCLLLSDPTDTVPVFYVGVKVWIFAILFLIYCIYMTMAQIANIGHTSHLCGAIYGFFAPCLFNPHLLVDFFSKLFS